MKTTTIRKTLAVLLAAALLAAALGACTSPIDALRGLFSKKSEKDVPFKGLKLEDYIDPGDYKGVTADFETLDGDAVKLAALNYFASLNADLLKAAGMETPEEKEARLEQNKGIEESRKIFALVFKEEKERAVIAKGDAVQFDYEGSAEGATEADMEGMKGSATLVMGSGGFIPGFEDQMIGQPLGKQFDVNVTFPDPYNSPTLAGKPAVFKCTAHKLYMNASGKIPAEAVTYLTQGSLSTEQELLAEIESSMAGQMENQNLQLALDAAQAGAKYLKELPKKEAEFYMQVYEKIAAESDQTLEQFLEANGYTDGLEKFREDINDKRVRQDLFVYAVAEKEGMEVTDAELQEQLDSYRQQQGGASDMTDAAIYDQMGGRNYVMRSIMTNKVVQFLYENAKDSPAAKTE